MRANAAGITLPGRVRAPPASRRREGIGGAAHETEGRRGLTIDDRQGGRYLGIPPESPFRR